jgi:uncharacterized Fe-S cluster-containing radical SAM superfamily enzyme
MAHIRITRESDIPLVGSLYFGVIDRGTSLLQVRPSCGCNISCPFCSVDAGPHSTTRATSYEVEMDYLLEAVEENARFKGPGVECHIDSPGEPLMYRSLPALVAAMKAIDEVRVVSLQTNGTLLDAPMIRALEADRLDRRSTSRCTPSTRALRRDLCLVRTGSIYQTIIDAARSVAAGQPVELLIAPVYLPGINDAEIPKLIRFAKETGAGKRFPPLGIQKFEHYRYGRSPKGVKAQSWWQFFNRSIKEWEKAANIPLRLDLDRDFGNERPARSFPLTMKKGEKVTVEIKAPGWIHGEMLGVANNRVVSIYNCPKASGQLRVKIVATKHNIYTAVPL